MVRVLDTSAGVDPLACTVEMSVYLHTHHASIANRLHWAHGGDACSGVSFGAARPEVHLEIVGEGGHAVLVLNRLHLPP